MYKLAVDGIITDYIERLGVTEKSKSMAIDGVTIDGVRLD